MNNLIKTNEVENKPTNVEINKVKSSEAKNKVKNSEAKNKKH